MFFPGERSESLKNESVLFIASKCPLSHEASAFLADHFAEVLAIFWERGDPFPIQANNWKGQWIISFKSDLLLPPGIISNAGKGAINFHPSLPYYRGIGGATYAIYNHDKKFGVSCHYMVKEIDSGKIIAVKYFDILNDDKSSELRTRAGIYTLILFYEIIQLILMDKQLPISKVEWGKKLYTQKELDRFCHELQAQNHKHNCLL